VCMHDGNSRCEACVCVACCGAHNAASGSLVSHEMHADGGNLLWTGPLLSNMPWCVGCSRWGCQWDKDCYSTNGTLSCGPGLYLFGQALHAIWSEDDKTPVFLNGMGQDNSTKWRQCGNYYPGECLGPRVVAVNPTLCLTTWTVCLSAPPPSSATGCVTYVPHVACRVLACLGGTSCLRKR
jgi:hypothetical protein